MARGDGRYKKWSACQRKARFEQDHVANRRAAELGLRAYECPHCAGWHLTHLPVSPTALREHHPRRPPRVSAAAMVRNQLREAEQILAKLLERQKAGVELPAAVVRQARERVDTLSKALEEARDAKDKP